MQHTNIIKEFADDLVKALDDNVAPWQREWNAGELRLPINAFSNKSYAGANALKLMIHQQRIASADNRWITYNQAQQLGGFVKKKSKGIKIIYFQHSIEKPKLNEAGKQIFDEKGKQQIDLINLEKPIIRTYVVFNGKDIENLPQLDIRQIDEFEKNERIEKILKNSRANIEYGNISTPHFIPKEDKIYLPFRENFDNEGVFYATLLHEFAHWTGHHTRLDRNIENPFGTKDYAKEELVAEITAFMLSASLDVGFKPSQHISYIKSWSKALGDKPTEIYKACNIAGRSQKYILNFEHIKLQDLQKISEEKTSQNLDNINKIEKNINKNNFTFENNDAIVNPVKNYNFDIDNISKNNAMAKVEKYFLNVPFSEKNLARDLGAKWDKINKKWYCKSNEKNKFSQWDKTENIQQTSLSPADEFLLVVQQSGLDGSNLILDGNLHRVAVLDGKAGNKDGAYRYHGDGKPAGFIQNHKTGFKTNWTYSGSLIDVVKPDNEQLLHKQKEREQQRLAMYKEAALLAQKEFDSLLKFEQHQYFNDKNLADVVGNYDLKIDEKNNIVIPIKNIKGEIQSLQKIGENGFKQFSKGGKISGGFAILGDMEQINSQENIFIASGYATAAAVAYSIGDPVIAAMQDGNLKDVAEEFTAKYPHKTIVIIGDDDKHNTVNSGRQKAQEAANAVKGLAIFPEFTGQPRKDRTDFSDLLIKTNRLHVLNVIKNQLKNKEKKLEKEKEKKLEKEKQKKISKGITR